MTAPLRRKRRKLPARDPHSLTGKVFYFSNLENDEECYELDKRLILIYEDQHESEPEYGDSQVFGVVINSPESKRLSEIFKAESQIVSHKIQSIEVMNRPEDLKPDGFDDSGSIFFITPKTKGSHPIKTDFRKFSLYHCETLDIVKKIALGIKDNDIPHIAVNGIVVLDRETIIELIRLGHAKERNATANIIFAEKPSERTFLAFPKEFDFKF